MISDSDNFVKKPDIYPENSLSEHGSSAKLGYEVGAFFHGAHLAPELSIFLEAQIGSGNIGHSWSLDSMDYGA